MSTPHSFNPNWASVPGDTISRILNEKNMSVENFANILGADRQFIKHLLDGTIMIDDNLAGKLSSLLGSTKQFWIKRESIYQSKMKELEKKWLDELPVKDMQRLGWLESNSDLLKTCLDFFNVSSYQQWKQNYNNVFNLTAFRKSPTLASSQYAISAWLRQGEIQSNRIDCNDWDPQILRQSIGSIRELIKVKSPLEFVPKLKQICAECGIAVVILRTPTGCPASGATKFLSERKAMILLSFRFLTDDHRFWFTFFHEIGHLLLHSDKTLFIEEDDRTREGRRRSKLPYSQEILIPKEFQLRLKTMAANQTEIKRLSKDADIPLGVIVGQLQFMQRLNKKFFEWI